MVRTEQEHREWPIHPTRLSALPRDACIVLEIRQAVSKYLAQHPEINNPVADLMAEEAVIKEDPWLRGLAPSIAHPITWSLPSSILYVLSVFHGGEIYFQG